MCWNKNPQQMDVNFIRCFVVLMFFFPDDIFVFGVDVQYLVLKGLVFHA